MMDKIYAFFMRPSVVSGFKRLVRAFVYGLVSLLVAELANDPALILIQPLLLALDKAIRVEISK